MSPRAPSLVSLTDSIDRLERRLGQVITYEDPVSTSSVPGAGPRRRPPPPASPGAGAADELGELVDRHRRTTGDVFALERTALGRHVIPVGHERDGGFDPWVPLLDIATSPAPGPRGALDAIEALADELSGRSAFKVAMGSVPVNFLVQHDVTPRAQTLPARSHLVEWLAALPRPLSWRLLVDPEAALAALNLHLV